jgi:hypothetical protein
MTPTPQDELMAAALASYVETLNRSPLGTGALTAAEIGELAELMAVATRARAALEEPAPAPGSARERVLAAIAATRRSRPPTSAYQIGLGWVRRAWMPTALAAALVFAAVEGLRPPQAASPPGLPTLTHTQAAARVPALLAGDLSRDETRAVLWHVAGCDQCLGVFHRRLRTGSRAAVPFDLARNTQ